MNRKIILLLAFLSVNAAAYSADVKLDQLKPEQLTSFERERLQSNSDTTADNSGLDIMTVYYPNANINSAIAKYKKRNYTGSLQELFSLVKKDPSNAAAYYYMGMAFTQVGKNDKAVEAYEKVIALNPNRALVDYATKGRDCITGGPACAPAEAAEVDPLDTFVSSPYGNGLSPELSIEMKQKQLDRVKQNINVKDNLNQRDIQQIKSIDKSKSSAPKEDKIASEPSQEDITAAIQVLKNAGMTIAIQPAQQENPANYMQQAQQMYQDPQMAEMSMLLGNNNNNSNNSMMQMLPYMMSQSNGQNKNIDPQVIQAMMMNSMMPSFDFNSNNNNNRY